MRVLVHRRSKVRRYVLKKLVMRRSRSNHLSTRKAFEMRTTFAEQSSRMGKLFGSNTMSKGVAYEMVA